MIIKVPLNGGLVTQADPNDVAASACTVLENAEFQKIGVIAKRSVLSAKYSSGEDMIELLRWYNDNISGDYYWIMIADDKNVKYSTNLTSWTDLEVGSGGGERPRISTFGNALRFSNGRTLDPYIYQYIDRDFFASQESPTPAWDDDIARPRDVISPYLTFETKIILDNTSNEQWFRIDTNMDGADDAWQITPFDLAANTYFYKYSLIFDGIQESPLSVGMIGDSSSTTGTGAVLLEGTIDTGSSLANWNKRVTGMNIYRAKNEIDSSYYKVASIATKFSPSDDQVSDAYKGTRTAYINNSTAAKNIATYKAGSAGTSTYAEGVISGESITDGTYWIGTQSSHDLVSAASSVRNVFMNKISTTSNNNSIIHFARDWYNMHDGNHPDDQAGSGQGYFQFQGSWGKQVGG